MKVNRIASLHIIVIFTILLICPAISTAAEDSLVKTLEMMKAATHAQSERIKVDAENIANENTTGSTPGANPYQRKIVYVKNKYDKKIKANLLKVEKYDVDKSEFVLKYDPLHPAADMDGYVKYPNVDTVIERADLMEAQRSYEASLGVIEVTRDIMRKTLEVIR